MEIQGLKIIFDESKIVGVGGYSKILYGRICRNRIKQYFPFPYHYTFTTSFVLRPPNLPRWEVGSRWLGTGTMR